MQDFITYYTSLKKTPTRELNKVLLPELGITYNTLYQKVHNNTFTKLEKEKIAEILHKPVEELFPKPAFEIFLANS